MNEMLQPTDIVGMSFWLITLAMAGATAFFFLERRRMPARWQATVTVLGVITLVATASYVFLSQTWVRGQALSTSYRFLDWQLTVPLQVVEFYLVLSAVAAAPAALFWRLLVASSVAVGAAYLGSAGFISPTLGFLVSLAGGLYILGELYLGEASRLNAGSGNERVQSTFNAIRLIATIGWAIYPLGYFMEFLGGGVDGHSINLIYNLADFLNKIAFGLVIYQTAASEAAGERRQPPGRS